MLRKERVGRARKMRTSAHAMNAQRMTGFAFAHDQFLVAQPSRVVIDSITRSSAFLHLCLNRVESEGDSSDMDFSEATECIVVDLESRILGSMKCCGGDIDTVGI